MTNSENNEVCNSDQDYLSNKTTSQISKDNLFKTTTSNSSEIIESKSNLNLSKDEESNTIDTPSLKGITSSKKVTNLTLLNKNNKVNCSIKGKKYKKNKNQHYNKKKN
jgi:hypothetical protein